MYLRHLCWNPLAGRPGPARTRAARAGWPGRACALAGSAALVTTAVLAGAVPQAQAITGCNGDPKVDHCYAIGRMGENWTGHFVPINAVGGDLHITCLSPRNPRTDFATYETWLAVDLNKYPVGTYWVEGGALDGIGMAGEFEGFQWFWAFNVPGGVNEYFQGGASLGTYENVSFYWQGGGTWNVYFAGNLAGGVDAGAYGGGSDTGLESTTPQVYFNGYTRWWQYADNNWNWHPADYAGYGEYLGHKGPLSVNGYVHNDHPGDDVTEQGTNSNSCPIAATQRPQAFKGTAGLAALARLAARANRAPVPASVQYVTTSWDKTAPLTGSRVTRTGQVYVLQLRGHFTAVDASVPPGARPPTGKVLTIVVDAATGMVIDTRLTRSAPSLTALGTVRPLAIH